MHGYYGRILTIDLNSRSSEITTIPEDIYKTYLGGKGLVSWLLYRLNPRGAVFPPNVFTDNTPADQRFRRINPSMDRRVIAPDGAVFEDTIVAQHSPGI